MARGDFRLYAPSMDQISIRAIVGSGTAVSINAGEPTIGANATAASWTGAVKIAADADPTTASGHRFTGIAKSDSTDTVAAAGYVDVWLPIPSTIYSGVAKTSTNANTQALVDALKFKRVIFDVTSTTWSVDTAAADALANGVVIVGGDYTKSMINFLVIPSVSIFGATN
jgi:hypothetical protein